jgi:predicted GNAT family acetyltransferase
VDGQTAYAQYDLTDGVIAFISTQTPPPLRGKGVASALIGDALRDARARGLKVRAECSFVADYLARHSEFSDLAR